MSAPIPEVKSGIPVEEIARDVRAGEGGTRSAPRTMPSAEVRARQRSGAAVGTLPSAKDG